MKKRAEILFALGGALLLSTGAVLTYLQSQPVTPQMSDLTLANLEALAFMDPDELDKDKPGGIEMELDCNDFCTRDPNKACSVPIYVNGTQLTYTCDSWRK